MALETIGSRIRKRRKELKLTQQDIATAMKDVTHVAISQWESDATSPNAKNLYELSLALDCNIIWLLNGNEPSNVAPAVSNAYKVPLISYVQAGSWTEICDFKDSTGYIFIMTAVETSKNAFALTVKGDSMEPEFKEGDMIVIDPEVKPIPGEFVVAVNGDEEATFKKYREVGYDEKGRMQFELIPLNSDYTILNSLKQPIKIIGTMVEHRIFRRKR